MKATRERKESRMGIFGSLFGKKKDQQEEPLVFKGKLPKFEIPQIARTGAKETAAKSPDASKLDIDLSMIEEESQAAPEEIPVSTSAPTVSREDFLGEEAAAPASSLTIPSVASAVRSSVRVVNKRKSPTGKQIGSLLLTAGNINEEQLKEALSIQESKGGLLGRILVKMQACSIDVLPDILGQQRTITTVDLKQVEFDPMALKALSRSECKRLRCIPFEKLGRLLCVAMGNVLDGAAKNEIREITQIRIKPYDALWEDISVAIDKYYPDITEEAEEAEKEEVARERKSPFRKNPSQRTTPEPPAPAPAEVTPEARREEIEIELPDDEPIRGEAAAAKQAAPKTATPQKKKGPEPRAAQAAPAPQKKAPASPDAQAAISLEEYSSQASVAAPWQAQHENPILMAAEPVDEDEEEGEK
jgi:hypothetical protein